MGPCCELLVRVIPQLASSYVITDVKLFPVFLCCTFLLQPTGNWIEPLLGDEWVVPLEKVYPLLESCTFRKELALATVNISEKILV